MLIPPTDLDHRQYILMRRRLCVDTKTNLKPEAFANFLLLIQRHHRLIYCNQINSIPLSEVKSELERENININEHIDVHIDDIVMFPINNSNCGLCV